MEIIGITGRLGSGKTYYSNQLLESFKDEGKVCIKLSFADPIKKILFEKFGLSKYGNILDFSNYKIKETINDSLNVITIRLYNENFDFSELIEKSNILDIFSKIDEKNYEISFRHIIQKFGTEIARSYNNNIWIDYMNQQINTFSMVVDIILIDDLRFLNEYEFINSFKNSKIIGLVTYEEKILRRRQKTIEIDKHSSETEIDLILDKIPKINIIEN